MEHGKGVRGGKGGWRSSRNVMYSMVDHLDGDHHSIFAAMNIPDI